MRRQAIAMVAGVIAVSVLAAGGAFAFNQMRVRQQLEDKAAAMTGGDPRAGRVYIKNRGCGACHQIPGVAAANGRAGPALTQFATKIYIGGRLTNTPANLALWVRDPHAVDPLNAMPSTGVTPSEARSIAAYLYTLN